MAKLIPQTANNGVTVLQAGVNNSTDVTLVAAAGSVLPQFREQEGSPAAASNKYCAVTVVSVTDPTVFEIMHVTDVNGNNITVERAQEGTTKQTFVTGDIVSHRLTAEIIGQIVAYAKAGKDLADLFPNVDGAVTATDEELNLLAGLAGETLATDAELTAAADAAQAGAEATAAAADAAMADGDVGDPLVARIGAPGWLAYVGNAEDGADVVHSANANISAGIHRVRSFTIDPGITLTQDTNGPLIILATGAITLGAGAKIDSAGRGAPGAVVSGDSGEPGYLGGSGAGAIISGVLTGAQGTDMMSAPSQAQLDALFLTGSLDWIKMRYGGGAGGAASAAWPGGAGGPLVILVSRTSIDIPATAEIDASGADGQGSSFNTSGGGGGGAIILMAPVFTNDAGVYTVDGGSASVVGSIGGPGWKVAAVIPGLGLTAL